MSQFIFGGGQLYGRRSDIANTTPIRFAAMQDVQLDFSGDTKSMFGSGNYALAIRRAHMKIEGKAKFGQVDGLLYNDLFFGQALVTGQDLVADREAGVVPAGGGAVVVANAATFEDDLGVAYAATGLPFKLVGANPIAGQYTRNGGSYTFAAGDAGVGFLVSYKYSGATGTSIPITNQLIGNQPTWRAVFTNTDKGKTLTVTLNACTSSKLSLPTKLDDFGISEIDFMAQDDGSGNIGTISFS